MSRAPLPALRLAASLLTTLVALSLSSCGGESPLNVLFVTLDTTRADHIGCYGHDGIETPHIDGLAAEGIRYDNAFSPVPVTLPAHTSMMTGRFPISHGVRENGGFYVDPEAITLAEILSDAGYDTAAVVGAFPLDSQTGIDQGFDLYDDDYPSSLEKGRHPSLSRFFDERPAVDVARNAMRWIENRGSRPFFLWTHFFDPHQPLLPPRAFAERYPHSAYDAEIASVDDALGQILARLDDQGLLDSTLVVVTADHGEGLGEHGESTHALLLYSSTLRVPLIVRDPSGPKGTVIRAPVTTVDLFSTLLERLGLDVPDANQGIPLPTAESEADPDREIYSETLFGSLIYGWSPMHRLTKASHVLLRGPSERLYDRATDPDELEDLKEREPERHQQLLRRLVRGQDELRTGDDPFSRGAITEEAMARLAALGYLGSIGSKDQETDEVDLDKPDPLEMMAVFDLHNEATNLIQMNRSHLAAPLLERARELDPNNPSVLLELSRAQTALGHLTDATATLDALLAIQPDRTTTQLALANLLTIQGQTDRALDHLARAADLDPNNRATKLLLAHRNEDLQRLDAAEAIYRALLADEEEDTLSANGLAVLLLRKGEQEEAAELLEALLERQPFYPPAWLNLGVLRYSQGRAEEAAEHARRALGLRPGYPQAAGLLRLAAEPPRGDAG